MKSNEKNFLGKSKVFCTLALAIIVAMLAIAIPASPALAAEDIDVYPSKGEIDDEIDNDGSGFTANKTVYIYFQAVFNITQINMYL